MGLLNVHNLQTSFSTKRGLAHVVTGMSFEVASGETLAIVGESGCGKSVTAMSILRLIDKPGAVTGRIDFCGRDLLTLSEADMRAVRGREISMVFQEPMTSLNPLLTIGRQIRETLKKHASMTSAESYSKAAEMLALVGLSSPEQKLKSYPHHLSGGMRQRVMIAMALACNPKLLIADEPTTALDVTVQAQILELMRKLRHEFEMAIILITHDLGVVAEMAERVIVMYAGNKVEEASVGDIFNRPAHPYTVGLLGAVAKLGASRDSANLAPLTEITGAVPDPFEPRCGCPFAPRCVKAFELCWSDAPRLRSIGPSHVVACHAA